MKRFAFAATLVFSGAMFAGPVCAQMEGIGNGGLGDAKAQNQPTSVGINNGYGVPGYGYAPPAPVAGYVTGRTPYGGRSAYISRHRHRHHARHW
ncbi:MAG: hypothetical protein JOZ16_05050 [Methylobacteriaceae bacterium]|nr:hypothetical protein [Methylobacteriaceae bacterium]